MTASCFARQFAGPAPGWLTHVELTWLAKRVEQRIRFGRPVASLRLDRHRRRVSFAPDAVFAIVRCDSHPDPVSSTAIRDTLCSVQ